MEILVEILLIAFFVIVFAFFIIVIGLCVLSGNLSCKIDVKKRKQLSCNHDFKYVQNVWGYAGDVLMHQYECPKCGRKDYLIARDDPDKDWNHGKGDGKLCDIDRQEYVRN